VQDRIYLISCDLHEHTIIYNWYKLYVNLSGRSLNNHNGSYYIQRNYLCEYRCEKIRINQIIKINQND